MEKLAVNDFESAYALLENAFIPAEMRIYDDMFSLFKKEAFQMYGYRDNEHLQAVAVMWEFSRFVYIEYIAVNPLYQKRGLGSRFLRDLKALYPQRLYILEVEEPTDEISQKRISFYKKNHFIMNTFGYIQPPLRPNEEQVDLLMMSYPYAIDRVMFEDIKQHIFCTVYQQKSALRTCLEEKIRTEGIVKEGQILKVDHFLNHQIDVAFLEDIGSEFLRLFQHCQITKILTIEASGIGVAVMTSKFFNYVPVVFAKKEKTSQLSDELYQTEVTSYTHQKVNHVVVSKQFLCSDDRVLILDDFLANGCAVKGLIDIVKQAGAKVEGIGIVIEKGYQDGGKQLRADGYHVESLAIIEEMDNHAQDIVFRYQGG